MIIRVKIQDKEYEVEIADLNGRPVLATVEGQTFEVWPDEQFAAAPAAAAAPARPVIEKPAPCPPAPCPPAATTGNGGATSANAVTAPIPGVIVAIAVKDGQSVASGEELCTLEAMKMKNAIRASRAGKIAAVKVAVGDHVRHGQVLVEFSE
ncbi:MAG: biotin/lipoyl-binding protein [Chloroflexi bacterium]|nr:biotin/lipoyl-binding protein [Chloroflexota bacterium]